MAGSDLKSKDMPLLGVQRLSINPGSLTSTPPHPALEGVWVPLFLSVYFVIDWSEDLFITQLLCDFGHRLNFSELQFPHWSNRSNDRID